jgi:hypothetical protein
MDLETIFKTVLLSPGDTWDTLQDDMLKLYKTPYSDIFHICIYKNLSESEYYKLLIYNKNILQHIILFTIDNKRHQINVLNRCIYLSDFWLKYISDFLFSSLGGRSVTFDNILTNINTPPPFIKYI